MDALIELKGARKEFGARVAVAGLDLAVQRGEIFGLLGHNGAGKSTAIGMMLGQVWPTAGEVRLFGQDVSARRQLALQKVGAIFETPVFYDYLSGWRNLEILSHYTGPTEPKRMAEVVEWVGLTGREHARVSTYSHGMRARLAVAQALLPNPELLILDEPSDGLDPEGIHEMRLTIQRLCRELGLTILLSSHLLNEVEQLCTRIAVLNQGRKVFDGALAQAIQQRNWFSLRTDEFENAVAALRTAGLVEEARDGRYIALANGVASDQVVRWLVQHDRPVHEIVREEQTLENFYLTLMRQGREAGPEGKI
ncbi:MAG: ABC transporter ATP-binding protein [Verrucomicrobiota bacterium]